MQYIPKCVYMTNIFNMFWYLFSAFRGSLHWFPDSMESICYCVHVGSIWKPSNCTTHGFCSGSYLCQVLHPLQPHCLSGLQAQLPQVPVSRCSPVQEHTLQMSVSAQLCTEGNLQAVSSQRRVQLDKVVQWATREPQDLQTLPLS